MAQHIGALAGHKMRVTTLSPNQPMTLLCRVLATSWPTPSVGAGEIGLTITGAADAGTLTIIDTTPVAVDDSCPDCQSPGQKRDHTVRRRVDLPVTGFPTCLHLKICRFTCINPACGREIFQACLTCADEGCEVHPPGDPMDLAAPGD